MEGVRSYHWHRDAATGCKIARVGLQGEYRMFNRGSLIELDKRYCVGNLI